jgi:hypothetical protein
MPDLNFWIVKVGEPAVFHKRQVNKKPLRAAMISSCLANLGNDVTWWTSNFQHHDKSYIANDFRFHQTIDENITVNYLPSIGYKKHISLRRFLDHKILSMKARKILRYYKKKPDLIFCSWPLVELTEVFYDYAKENNIPFVIDIRDQWPDVIYRKVYSQFGLKANFKFLLTYERILKKCFLNADSIVTISPSFLQWAYKRSNRVVNALDMIYPLSSTNLSYKPEYTKDVVDFWRQNGVIKSNNILRIVLVGTLLEQHSLINFLKVLTQGNINKNIQFVICGSGQLEKRIMEINSQNVIFSGYINQIQMSYLFKISDVGLLPYDNAEDFLMSIPNKVGEYLSGGLHVLTSLKGEVYNFFKDTDLATFYKPHDLSNIELCLNNLYQKKSQIRKMKNTAIDLYLDKLNAKKNYNNLASHLESLAIKSK